MVFLNAVLLFVKSRPYVSIIFLLIIQYITRYCNTLGRQLFLKSPDDLEIIYIKYIFYKVINKQNCEGIDKNVKSLFLCNDCGQNYFLSSKDSSMKTWY